MKQEDLLKKLEEHKDIIVDYGKGHLDNKHVLEKATWDKDKKAYISETGIWDMKLLLEIIQGKVENVSIMTCNN